MTLDFATEEIRKRVEHASPLGATLKIAFDAGSVYIDGTGEKHIVSNDEKEANCTIKTTLDTFEKMGTGDLNPMTAVMTGLIRIEGDMGVAMRAQSFLS